MFDAGDERRMRDSRRERRDPRPFVPVIQKLLFGTTKKIGVDQSLRDTKGGRAGVERELESSARRMCVDVECDKRAERTKCREGRDSLDTGVREYFESGNGNGDG